MGWDGEFLRVPEIPYSSDLYNETEDAIVTLLEADSYTQTLAGSGVAGEGGIVLIEARHISDESLEAIVNEAHEGVIPAIYVDAQSKTADEDDLSGMWTVPIGGTIAVLQGAAVVNTLDNNTKRRLGEIERVLRMKAGAHASGGFWNSTTTWLEDAFVQIGQRDDMAYFGVGVLHFTVRKEISNRQEALD